jgi:hypothetical protein
MSTLRELELMNEELKSLAQKIDHISASVNDTNISVAVIQHELQTRNAMKLNDRVHALENFKSKAIGYGSAAMVGCTASLTIGFDYIKSLITP